jgi:CHAD domain-containing protein
MREPALVLEPGADGAMRLARALASFLAGLARRLDGTLDDATVHRVRKELKRARAALRLLRPALGRARFDRVNLALRDAGRALAGRRDARVRLDTLRDLARDEGVDGAALQPLVAELRAELASAAGAAPTDDPASARAPRATPGALIRAGAATLRAARVRGDWPVVADGLRQVYRRGREALRVAAAAPTAGCLHEWRKQVKHAWHAFEILGPAWPRPMRALAREANELADLLGDDHDLAMLRERLATAELDRRVRDRALAVLDARRDRLQRDAFLLGRHLYAEPPKRLGARLGRWHQAGSERSG